MAPTWLGKLVVSLVVCLISFIAYSSQIFVVWPWYGSALSIELLVLLVPFNLLVAMVFWNYALCVRTNPGSVPSHWQPDTHADGFEVKKLTGRPRFCRTCNVYKPPRAHHCRQCNHCVLRMDHHCPWINNCVGHNNHGHFIRFLFYVDLACSYHIAMVVRRVVNAMRQPYWSEPDSTEFIFILLNFVACVPVLLAVGAFSLYHFSSLMSNTTTIESWEKDKAATLYRKGRIEQVKFPYNIGRKKNIESVLGPTAWLWCWPSIAPGSGLKFEVSHDEELSQTAWPPQDPTIPENNTFKLPDSPWTYENGSVNPDLRPRNRQQQRRHQGETISAVPPYHPDYREDNEEASDAESYEEDVESSGDEYDEDRPRHRVRRGSEGFEFRLVDREQMLQRYLEQQSTTEGLDRRYNRYVPESHSSSDSSDGETNDIPLIQQSPTSRILVSS